MNEVTDGYTDVDTKLDIRGGVVGFFSWGMVGSSQLGTPHNLPMCARTVCLKILIFYFCLANMGLMCMYLSKGKSVTKHFIF